MLVSETQQRVLTAARGETLDLAVEAARSRRADSSDIGAVSRALLHYRTVVAQPRAAGRNRAGV